MWSKNDLNTLAKDKLKEYKFFVVSNRQPYIHYYSDNQIAVRRAVGGLVTALEPVMQSCHGIWVAFGNGDADRQVTDEYGKIQVPAEDPSFTLKRVWLTKEEEQGYYSGFSNSAVWPLCHTTFVRPAFRDEDWDFYKLANLKFAHAIIKEAGDTKCFIWIQDFHLCLLPKYLKELRPNQFVIAHFWHIPWPGYETFRVCPQKKEILEGLLANDLLGFHIRHHCLNFIDAIDRELESKIDRERMSVIKDSRETLVRPYPISIDYEDNRKKIESDEVRKFMAGFMREYQLNGLKLLVGVDRIDYTKGLPEKLLALELLFDRHPDMIGKIILIQIGVPTRLDIAEYKILNDQIEEITENINRKYARDGWRPVILIRRQFTLLQLLALYQLSDACIVSSLHDGMNLVAKEYISGCSENRGMLVLSQFTGAAREFTDAVLINPYDRTQFCEGIYQALTMPEEERAKRITRMREIIQTNNIYRWAGKIISELLKFDFKE